jgi:hypothetical protein
VQCVHTLAYCSGCGPSYRQLAVRLAALHFLPFTPFPLRTCAVHNMHPFCVLSSGLWTDSCCVTCGPRCLWGFSAKCGADAYFSGVCYGLLHCRYLSPAVGGPAWLWHIRGSTGLSARGVTVCMAAFRLAFPGASQNFPVRLWEVLWCLPPCGLGRLPEGSWEYLVL